MSRTGTVNVDSERRERLLYDTPSAARLLDTTERRIHELRRAGVLCAVQDGRKFKFTADELRRYVDRLPAYEPGAAS